MKKIISDCFFLIEKTHVYIHHDNSLKMHNGMYMLVLK